MADGIINGTCSNKYVSTWIKWWTTISVPENASYINVELYAQKSSASTAPTWGTCVGNINIDGADFDINESITLNNNNSQVKICSTGKYIKHNDDGSKSINVNFEWDISGTTAYHSSGADNCVLDNIPRYATILTWDLVEKYINRLSFSITTDKECDSLGYSINGGAWKSTDMAEKFSITDLVPNTTYKIKVRVKAKDSQLWTETGEVEIATEDIAKISSIDNFLHGDGGILKVSNPANISNLEAVMKIANVQILKRTVKAGSNTIKFTDAELDNAYKKYGTSNTLTATFILTGEGYTNSKTCTITLKGNQKTVYRNVNNSWKRGKVHIKINNAWKRAVVWKKMNGKWRRCI